MNLKIRKTQKGLTLIELLIAMTLGLFLIGGVIQVFLGSKRTYSVVTSQSYAQESARFGSYFLEKGLRHAGYWSALVRFRRFDVQPDLFDQETAIVTGSNNNDDSSDLILDDSDDIRVRMMGSQDGGITNCLGTVITATQLAVDHYYLAPANAANSENVPSLVCASEIFDFDSADYVITGGGVVERETLVSGIDDMQIQYGIAAADENSISRYVTADVVGNWADVRAVRIAVLGTSNDDSSGLSNTQSYSLLDEDYDATDQDDRRARVVFEQTVSLRNFIGT